MVIVDDCSNFGRKTVTAFWVSLWGLLGTTHTVYLRLIGKLVVDFLFVLIEHFSLSVTAEALRTKYRLQIVFSVGKLDERAFYAV